jgi:hypothetical protein
MNSIGNINFEGFEPLAQDLSGWGGNSPIFNRLICELTPKTIIEVGTWKGQSAINMANSIKSLSLNSKIYCVDTWLGSIEFWTHFNHTEDRDLLIKFGYPQIYYQFLSNVLHNNVQDIIIPVPMPSLTACKYFKTKGIFADLIYIDASHEEEDIYLDVVNYWEVLSSGGVIFGDDFSDDWPGIAKSIKRFSEKIKIEYEVFDYTWIIRKP